MIDVEVERARFEAWMNVERPSLLRRHVTTYLSTADIYVNDIALDVWLAAKRDAEQEK